MVMLPNTMSSHTPALSPGTLLPLRCLRSWRCDTLCPDAILRLPGGLHGLLRCLLGWDWISTCDRLIGGHVRLHRPASAPSLSLSVADTLLLDCGLLTLLVRLSLMLPGALAVVAFRLGPVLLSLQTCHNTVGGPSFPCPVIGLLSCCSSEPWPPSALPTHVAIGGCWPRLR